MSNTRINFKLCEKFAPEFKEIYKKIRESEGFNYNSFCFDNGDLSDDLKYEVNRYFEQTETSEESIVGDSCGYFETALKTDEETLIKFLNYYFDEADEWYQYWEFEYGGFGSGYMHFCMLRPDVLYLCSKYFESIGEIKKVNKCVFYACLKLIYEIDEFGKQERTIFGVFEDKLKVIKSFIFADWQCVTPRLAYKIGKYYLEKKIYKEAYQFFKLAASLDYDGRQHETPFGTVAINQYQVGLMHYKGLGRKRNIKKALQYFRLSAVNVGLDYAMAIMGDIYFKGDGVKKNWELAYKCYTECNIYNSWSHPYTFLNSVQKRRLQKIIDTIFDIKTASFSDLVELKSVYKYVLNDSEKYDEVDKTLNDFVNSIPLEKRDSRIDEWYVDNKVKEFLESQQTPTENTGYIPENLKVGDIFTFGKFNNEPIEWRALEQNEDGSFFVMATKALTKMSYVDWNSLYSEKFVNMCFTKDECKHIVNKYPVRYDPDKITIKLIDYQKFEELKEKFPELSNISETEYAKNLSATEVMVYDRGATSNGWCSSFVGKICPTMNIKIK